MDKSIVLSVGDKTHLGFGKGYGLPKAYNYTAYVQTVEGNISLNHMRK